VLRTRKAFEGLELSATDRLRLIAAAVRIGGPGILRAPPMPSIEASVSGSRHSLRRDRQAVRHHYDLSNDFYRLVLGPTMVYSCAYFATEDDSLERAQEQKLDLICRKLRLRPGESLLDIGCGWGSLLLHAAVNYGVRAVGVTLSEPQAALGRERITQQGLRGRVEIRVADYRELRDGPYDKIASVGMYEHVGREKLDEYTAVVSRLLAEGGLFLNHGIARLHSLRPSRDAFVYRYIFPDGDLHPVSDLISSLQATGLEVRDVESLRDHYPLTLRRWLANLRANRERARALVGPDRERTWELYLLASAVGFEEADITVYQVLSTRPDGPRRLPLTRPQLLTPAPDDLCHAPQ
jgi:cyclopropane-fatty-acyl-phospholipid synthase